MTRARRRASEPSCAAGCPEETFCRKLATAAACRPSSPTTGGGPVEGDVAQIMRDRRRPAGLEQQRAAAVQAEERGGEVLDLEGCAVLDLRDAEAGAAAAQRTERRVGGGGGGGDAGLPHQVQRHVEH